MNIRKERALQEAERKAEKIALAWFEKNYEKVFKNPQISPEQIPKNAAKLYREIVRSRKRLVQWTKDLKEKEAKELQKGKEKEAESSEYKKEELFQGPMYDVPPEVMALLYSDDWSRWTGREGYLRARWDGGPPDSRFREPQSMAMLHGWDIRRRAWPTSKEHARVPVIRDSFYRRNGALEPDDLYRRPPFSSAHVAVELL